MAKPISNICLILWSNLPDIKVMYFPTLSKCTTGSDFDVVGFVLDLTQLYLLVKVVINPPQSVSKDIVAKLLFHPLNSPTLLFELF